MTKRIITELPQGGSGTGFSHYLTASACPRKARLSKEQEDKSYGPGTVRRDAGTIFHVCAEYWHRYGVKVSFDLPSELEDAVNEGTRMFDFYAEHYPPDAWGKVLATEMQLPPEGDEGAQNRIAEAMGIAEFTARLDLVTEVEEPHVPGIAERTGITLEPGVYIIDHKTKGKRGNKSDYMMSPQFLGYPMALKAVKPAWDVKGMIANEVVGHKTMTDNSMTAHVVPLASDITKEGLRQWLCNAKILAGTDMPNWASCNRFGPCEFYTSGLCDRR